AGRLASTRACGKATRSARLNASPPLSLILPTPLVLVVTRDLPVKTVADLLALLRQKPGELHYGHGGPGSAIHLAAELFQSATDTKMNAVAYRGAPIALNDLIGGRIQLVFADVGSVMGQIEAGGVVPLPRRS